MTKQQNNFSAKLKGIIALVLLFLLSFTLFFISACGNTETEEDTVYKKVESDGSDLVNGSFEYGTADISISDLPQTSSLTGWGSASTENGSSTSSVPSGIISTKEDAFKALIDKLYDNSTFKSKISTIYPDVDTSKTVDEVKEALYAKNPGVHDDAAEGEYKVYMLNSYITDVWNTAITTTSSSSLTLEKGEYAKISFYVKVPYVTKGEYKVNFRINNSLNSTNQAKYVLANIGTNEWKQYNIYVKGDENYGSTLTAVMSIGYSPATNTGNNYSEGTAYFDDIVFEKVTVDKIPSIDADCTQNLKFGSKDYSLTQAAKSNVYDYLYDMTLKTPDGYFNDVNLASLTITNEFTGNRETSKTKFGSESSEGSLTITAGELKVTDIKNAGISITLNGNDSLFKVNSEEYMLLTFDVTDNLTTPGSTLITILVYDEDNNENSVLTFTDTEEVAKTGMMLKNNDPDNTRSFRIVIVVGPTDPSSASSKYDFASGEIIISNIKVATGLNYQYKRNDLGETIYPNEETDNYSFYSFYSANYQNVNVDDYAKDDDETYYVKASSSYGDNIRLSPVAAEGYRGVSYNSNYVKADGTDNDINARTGISGDGNKNYAGLINTKFDYNSISDSDTINLKDNLNYTDENDIQPLMIYNNTADSYGFIGNSFSVAASANASISVKVKAVGTANAYVYLVNTADKDKSVFQFEFTGNVKGNSYGKKFTADLAFTGITESDMDENGWKTLTFYIANGATALDLRLELWNGSRDGGSKSQGFVFFAFDAFNDDETFTPSTLSSAFSEPSSVSTAFTTSGNPLYDNAVNNGDTALRTENLQYQRELDATEIKYNSEYPDSAVSYEPNYVWAESDNVLYSVLNTIDPVAVDPYDNTEEDSGSGCTAQTDPATFWLSFSSILLAVVLVLAIIMLVIKNVRRRHKANKSDAKSHYNVTSRYSGKKSEKTKRAKREEKFESYEDETPVNNGDVKDEPIESSEAEPENESDDYVYGEVQDFGTDNDEDNKDKNN